MIEQMERNPENNPVSWRTRVSDDQALVLPRKVNVIAGADSLSHPLVIQSLGVRAALGQQLGVVVGHNRLDVYALAKWARENELSEEMILSRVKLSRAFTCHQLHQCIQRIGERHPSEWSVLYVLGMMEMFYDEDVKYAEVSRLLMDTLATLKRLAAGGLRVLVTVSAPKEPGRERLLGLVQQQAGVFWTPPTDQPALPAPRQLALPLGR